MGIFLKKNSYRLVFCSSVFIRAKNSRLDWVVCLICFCLTKRLNIDFGMINL